MRSSVLLIPIMLLATPAAALEVNTPTDTSGVPIMEAAKAMVLSLRPVAENPFAGARILSDAKIAALIPVTYSILETPETPPIMALAKLALEPAK